METNDSSGVVILNAVRCPAGVYIITNLQQSWSLVLVASNKPSVVVVPERRLMYQCRKVGGFGQILGADGMEVVAALRAARRILRAEVARLELQKMINAARC